MTKITIKQFVGRFLQPKSCLKCSRSWKGHFKKYMHVWIHVYICVRICTIIYLYTFHINTSMWLWVPVLRKHTNGVMAYSFPSSVVKTCSPVSRVKWTLIHFFWEDSGMKQAVLAIQILEKNHLQKNNWDN